MLILLNSDRLLSISCRSESDGRLWNSCCGWSVVPPALSPELQLEWKLYAAGVCGDSWGRLVWFSKLK